MHGSLHASQVAHQDAAYPGFCSMKRLGVFLLPPGWDACPSGGHPQQSLVRAQTRAARSGEERTNHEASVLASRLVIRGTFINNIYQISKCKTHVFRLKFSFMLCSSTEQ